MSNANHIQNPARWDWHSYNKSQVNEKTLFMDILGSLCAYVPPQENNRTGRPKADPADLTFACVSKVYERLSSRRLTSDLEITREEGYISRTPHFNSVLKHMGNPELTPILIALIQLSSMPLRGIETTFAVDASGLSDSFYSRWVDYRLERGKKIKNWLKVHLICGTKTNIVTHVIITDGNCNDSPHLPCLVEETSKHFDIEEVSADKAYSSRKNLEVVCRAGGVPYIPFRKSARLRCGGSFLWTRMLSYYLSHYDEFLEHYHKRSNVESAFSMLKRKFEGKLMMKNEVGRVNESLSKVLCHNICVLIKEFYVSGIIVDFKESAHLFPKLHIK